MIVVLLALAGVPAAMAQTDAGAHDVPGSWVGIGMGAGRFALSCGGCVDQSWRGFAGSATIGWSLKSRIQLSVRVTGLFGGTEPSTSRVASVDGTVSLYPLRRSNILLFAGAGYGRLRVARSGAAPDTVTASGLEWRIGAGYDVPLGNGFSVVPAVEYARIAARPATINGAPSNLSVTGETARVSVAVDWHWAPIQWLPGRAR